MLCTHEFEEIVLTEDEELVGMRFRHFRPPLAACASAFHSGGHISLSSPREYPVEPMTCAMYSHPVPSGFYRLVVRGPFHGDIPIAVAEAAGILARSFQSATGASSSIPGRHPSLHPAADSIAVSAPAAGGRVSFLHDVLGAFSPNRVISKAAFRFIIVFQKRIKPETWWSSVALQSTI
jgi:hypothetical protein